MKPRRVRPVLCGVVAAMLLGASTPAMAIPSPEVVVSFFSNAAQIFGLLTLAVGGAFFSRRRIARRGRGRSATTAGGRWSGGSGWRNGWPSLVQNI